MKQCINENLNNAPGFQRCRYPAKYGDYCGGHAPERIVKKAKKHAALKASRIAAIPLLLAAAEKFHAAMDNWYDGPEHPATDELLDAWEQARVAIAAATEEPT